jgi:phage-related minor tail protein
MGLTGVLTLYSAEAYHCMKGLFDDFKGNKNKLDTITTQFMDAAACSCSSSWDEVMALCTQYQALTNQRITAKYLQEYILKHFGVQLDGSKDYLQRIALTGVSE